MLCEVGCRKVNFEEIWCRKNVELYKSTKYVNILRLTAVVLRNYAPQIVFWCKLVPPKSEMLTKCGSTAGKVMPKAPKGARINREGSKRTPKGSQSKPTGWHVEPKGCQKGTKGHRECIQKSMSEKGRKWDHCQKAIFPIKLQ